MDGNLLESVATYSDGTYQFTVSCAKEYELVASNPDYLNDKKRIEILEENYHSALHTNMNLSKIEKAQPVANKMSPIYYEFDTSNITQEAASEMDKIADIMKENENLIIEASSFTDSQGTNAYNIQLSNRRAKAAVDYLKSKGIDESRIRSKGYGEEKLINQCVNGVDCQDDSHKMNRRTEFNFVNIPADVKKKKPTTTKTKVAIQNKKTVVPVATKSQNIREVAPVEKVALSEVKELPKSDLVPQTTEKVALEEAEHIESAKVETVKVAATDHKINTATTSLKSLKLAPVAAVEEKSTEEQPVVKQELIAENKIEKTENKSGKVEEKAVVAVVPEVKKETTKKETIAAVVPEQKEETTKKEVKEAVIINYNSTIVATNPESNKVLNYIVSEKGKMIDQLSELEKKYEDAIPKHPTLSDSLKMHKDKIASIILNAQELEETGWSNIIEYKNNVLHYKKKYRDLMVSKGRNRVSGSSTRRERQIAHTPTQASQSDVAQVEKEEPKVAQMEENLSVDNVEITAMKMNGNGKYQKTTNANKTDLIKVSFKLLSNEKVGSGRKEAHLILQNPDGNVEEAKGIFTMKNGEKESKYTDHAIINYNNHDVDVTMFIQRKGKNLEKGVYPVKVFLEGELMTVTKLNLQNSY